MEGNQMGGCWGEKHEVEVELRGNDYVNRWNGRRTILKKQNRSLGSPFHGLIGRNGEKENTALLPSTHINRNVT